VSLQIEFIVRGLEPLLRETLLRACDPAQNVVRGTCAFALIVMCESCSMRVSFWYVYPLLRVAGLGSRKGKEKVSGPQAETTATSSQAPRDFYRAQRH